MILTFCGYKNLNTESRGFAILWHLALRHFMGCWNSRAWKENLLYSLWWCIIIISSWWRPQMETFFRVTSPLCGEFTGHRWIPRTKASDAELWCLLWSAPCLIGWVNNGEAGDLTRHRAHYVVCITTDVGTLSWIWSRYLTLHQCIELICSSMGIGGTWRWQVVR